MALTLPARRPPDALAAGQLEAARALLEHGASLELGCEGSPPLHVAVCVAAHGAMQEFALAAMALLLQFGADPYERFVSAAWTGAGGCPFIHGLAVCVSCVHAPANAYPPPTRNP